MDMVAVGEKQRELVAVSGIQSAGRSGRGEQGAAFRELPGAARRRPPDPRRSAAALLRHCGPELRTGPL